MEYHNPNDYWMPDLSGLTEEEQEEVRATSLLCGCGMYVILAIVLFVAMLFSSCTTTKYAPVIEQRTDTLIQTKVLRDSVWLHDSIVQKMKEDTVILERWHTRYVERLRIDTLYESRTDSVPMAYPVTEYIEKDLSWWQRTQMYAGDVLLVAVLLIVGFFVFKLVK